MFNNYALIIGVEDYSDYDRSAHLPPGTSDNTGARNDAKAFYRQCLAMGFSPERIRVLTSPKLAPSDLGPEATAATVGEATHDSIFAAISALATNLTHVTPSVGLLTFSGHGVGTNGIALCPADVTTSLDKVIHLAEIRSVLGNVADNFTMVLDCCRPQEGIAGKNSLRERLEERAEQRAKLGVPERTIVGCKRNQQGQTAVFGGTQMGAFTWAITSAMSQWKATEEKGVLRLDVSYGELAARANSLLRNLSFDQDPQVIGSKEVDALAFLHPGKESHAGETFRDPDAVRGTLQIDGGYKHYKKYEINLVDDQGISFPLVVMAVTNASGTLQTSGGNYSVTSGKEYWFVDRSIAQNKLSNSSYHIEIVGGGEFYFSGDPVALGSCTYAESCATDTTWDATDGSWPANTSNRQFVTTSGSPPTYLAFVLNANNSLRTVYWYQTGSTNISPANVVTRRAVAGTDLPAGNVAKSILSAL